MILQEINSKMPIYKDCTFGEILVVGTSIFLAFLSIFPIVTKLIFGYAIIGIVISFLSVFHVTKYSLSRLQKMKYGKPYGYYWQLIIKWFIDNNAITGLYVTRTGKWSPRREK